MTPRFLTGILLFLSSYAPLGLIMAVQDFKMDKKAFEHPTAVGIVLTLSLLVIVIPFALLRRLKGGKVYTIARISNKTGELVNYALPYLVTFVGLRLSDPTAMISFGIFMLLFCALTLKTQALWINPLLALCGYRLYEVDLTSHGAPSKTVMLISPTRLEATWRCRITGLTEFQFYASETDIDHRSSQTKGAGEQESLTPD
ncbi:MAG TPA: hypothetical protein VN673_17695 [Clostridia bacterium]|nr:hypothetical protein [Clostridia bacterium]